MSETLILNAAVAVQTVYENTARGSGKPFWNVVTDSKDRFTAFERAVVAPLIDGRSSTVIKGRDGGPDSLAYNLNPPLNTVVFFEARATGKILVPTPDGTPEPVGAPPAASVNLATNPSLPTYAAAAGVAYKPPYRANTGYQKGGGSWKPRDERPSLLTMTESYVKDGLVAIIGVAEDLKTQDPDRTANWFADKLKAVTGDMLTFNLEKLKGLGVCLDQDGCVK